MLVHHGCANTVVAGTRTHLSDVLLNVAIVCLVVVWGSPAIGALSLVGKTFGTIGRYAIAPS